MGGKRTESGRNKMIDAMPLGRFTEAELSKITFVMSSLIEKCENHNESVRCEAFTLYADLMLKIRDCIESGNTGPEVRVTQRHAQQAAARGGEQRDVFISNVTRQIFHKNKAISDNALSRAKQYFDYIGNIKYRRVSKILLAGANVGVMQND